MNILNLRELTPYQRYKEIKTEFEKKIKHLNYIFGIGINVINDFFKIDNLAGGKFSKNIFKIFNRDIILKKYSIKFADRGINF